MGEAITLYKIEVRAGVTPDGATDLEVRGLLTLIGRAAMEADPAFRGMIEKLTLVTAKVTEEFYGGEDVTKLYRGRGCQTPEMQEHLKAAGAVAMEGSNEQTTMRNSEVPASSSVHTGAAGVGQEGESGS